MTSISGHARTQSALPSLDTTYTPALPFDRCHVRSGSTIGKPYNNYTDYTVRLVDHTRNSFEDRQLQVVTPPKAVAPPPAALGSRLLTSLSNAQPAVAALSRKGSVLHSRAKSLAGIVPKLSTNNAASTPPKTNTANRIFDTYFGGQSAPVRLGAPVSPTKEKEESDIVMDYFTSFTKRPALRRIQSSFQNASVVSVATNSSSRLSRKPKAPVASKQQPQDDFVALDINNSLFPNGPADPLDPASFNNLLLTASTLLLRMQMAYKEKVDYIASIRPEIDAQNDEVEEAETRATLLKGQLEEMSLRAQEQEKTIKEMANELAAEKIKSFEAQQALEAAKTIRVVPNPVIDTQETKNDESSRRRRGSSSNASDSGFESDLESIFSSYSVPSTPVLPQSLSRVMSYDSTMGEERQGNKREMWPMRNKPAVASNNNSAQRLGREGAAWATVEVLRTENGVLKKRVMDLEDTLQGCIELVSV